MSHASERRIGGIGGGDVPTHICEEGVKAPPPHTTWYQGGQQN